MSAKKKAGGISAANLAFYDRLVATDPTLSRKGVTVPYTSVSGKMFSYLDERGELRLRLPQVERDAFMKKYRTKPVVQHGVAMTDWVAVPTSVLGRTAELKPWLVRSRAYAEQLGAKKAPKVTAKDRGASRRGGA
jgi:hypothetical protein